MARVINKSTFEYRRSAHTQEYDPANWLINPDLSAVVGVLQKYWKVENDAVVEMNQAEKDAVDAAAIPHDPSVKAYSEMETQNGSGNYHTKALMTPTNINPSRQHKISWYCEVNNTSTSGRTVVEVAHDGTVIAEPSIESEDPNDWVPFSGFAFIDAGVVPSEITLKFKRMASGTSKVRRARLEIKDSDQ